MKTCRGGRDLPRLKRISMINTLAALSWLALMAPTLVEGADPAWKSEVKLFTKGTQPEIKPMSLVYTMSWNGKLNSGHATMVFDKKHKQQKKIFLAQAYGRSTGVAGALFPFNFVYSSFMQRGSYKPLVFVSQETDKSEKVVTKNQYRENRVIHERTITQKSDGKVEKSAHTFAQRNMHDTLSAILYIRGRKLNNGDVLKLALHPFKSAQYAQVTVLGRENHAGYKCIKLDLKIKKIDMKTQQLKAYKKLKKATLWISDDSDRILIELRSKVFIGDVRMVLTERKP